MQLHFPFPINFCPASVEKKRKLKPLLLRNVIHLTQIPEGKLNQRRFQ